MDDKYLLIIDYTRNVFWYEKMNYNKAMNVKLILQTIYRKHYSKDIRNYIVKVSDKNELMNFKSILLDSNYIKEEVINVMSIM